MVTGINGITATRGMKINDDKRRESQRRMWMREDVLWSGKAGGNGAGGGGRNVSGRIVDPNLVRLHCARLVKLECT